MPRLLFCLLLTLSGLPPWLARAQDDQGEQLEPPPPGDSGTQDGTGGPGAPADSGTVTIIDRLGIQPQYTTSVDVNKTNVGWTQNLKMERALGPFQMDNTWSVVRNQNSAQNNYELRDGKLHTKFEYQLSGDLGLSTGANLDQKKTLSFSDVGRTVRNSDEFDWFLSAEAPGHWFTRMLGLEEGSMKWDVTAAAGFTQSIDVRQSSQKDAESGRFKLTRSDSTQAEGGSRSLGSRLSWQLTKSWRLEAAGNLDQGQQDSRTRQFQKDARTDVVSIDSILVAPGKNRSRRANGTATWNPNPNSRVTINGQAIRTFDRSYSALAKKLETTEGRDDKLGFDLKATPFWGVTMDARSEVSQTNLSYSASVSQGRGRKGKRAGLNVSFVFGEPFFFLKRIKSISDLQWSDDDNTFQAAKTFRSKQFNLSQQFSRPLGQRVTAVLKGEGNLSQSFYRDHSQDRDDLRLLGDLTLGYTPTPKWDTRISGQLGKKKSLSIPSATSASSFTTNSYQIGAEVTYKPWTMAKINQKYTFNADYSFYNFAENRNFLARLTEVRTSFTSNVGARASVGLTHLWQFRDSGRFGRPNDGGARVYTKQTEDTYQTFEATTGYQFSEGFRLDARQRIEVRDRLRLDTRAATHAREGLEFTGGMTLDHAFSQAFNVSAKIDRTQSIREKNFWRISGTATRNF